MPLVNPDRVGFQRLFRIKDSGQHFVVENDRLDGFARRPDIVRDDGRENIADAVRDRAFGHKGRPILIDGALPDPSGNIGRGHDPAHARKTSGNRRIDPVHPDTRLRREQKRRVQHFRERDVIDVGPLAKHELLAVHLRQAGPDLRAVVGFRQRLAVERARCHFDRIENLHESRTAADVVVKRRCDLVPRRKRLLADQMLGADNDPRNAESALQSAAERECFREDVPFPFGESLESQNPLAVRLLGRNGAGRNRLVLDDHRAAPAGSLRGASVLGRYQPGLFAQKRHQGHPVVDRRGEGLAIQIEFDSRFVFGFHIAHFIAVLRCASTFR